MLQDVSDRPLGARNASKCLWQSHLEQEVLQDVSGRATWSKKFFQDVSGRATWSKKRFKMSLAESHMEQEMLQDVSGRGARSKKCFKMSLAEALGARNASRCLWQRRSEQEMLQDVL